jgi:hypothetical protein
MRWIAISTLAVLLGGCASAPPFAEPANRAAAVGKSKAEILQQFGEPTEIGVDGEEQTLIYIYDDVVLYGPSGPAAAIAYHCEVTFHLSNDRVTSVESNGPDCDG